MRHSAAAAKVAAVAMAQRGIAGKAVDFVPGAFEQRRQVRHVLHVRPKRENTGNAESHLRLLARDQIPGCRCTRYHVARRPPAQQRLQGLFEDISHPTLGRKPFWEDGTIGSFLQSSLPRPRTPELVWLKGARDPPPARPDAISLQPKAEEQPYIQFSIKQIKCEMFWHVVTIPITINIALWKTTLTSRRIRPYDCRSIKVVMSQHLAPRRMHRLFIIYP